MSYARDAQQPLYCFVSAVQHISGEIPHFSENECVCVCVCVLEWKEIGLSSNKTVMHLDYMYTKLERKIREILNFNKKSLFVVSPRDC